MLLTDAQRERIRINRRKAQEKRAKKALHAESKEQSSKHVASLGDAFARLSKEIEARQQRVKQSRCSVPLLMSPDSGQNELDDETRIQDELDEEAHTLKELEEEQATAFLSQDPLYR